MDLELKAKLRPIAREKAAWFSNELDKVAQGEGNVHRASIDLSDELDEFAASLLDDEREMFYSLYAEELEANTAEINQKADTLFAEAAASEANTQAIGAVVGFVVFIIVLLFVFLA